jgi:hypothetical protein
MKVLEEVGCGVFPSVLLLPEKNNTPVLPPTVVVLPLVILIWFRLISVMMRAFSYLLN